MRCIFHLPPLSDVTEVSSRFPSLDNERFPQSALAEMLKTKTTSHVDPVSNSGLCSACAHISQQHRSQTCIYCSLLFNDVLKLSALLCVYCSLFSTFLFIICGLCSVLLLSLLVLAGVSVEVQQALKKDEIRNTVRVDADLFFQRTKTPNSPYQYYRRKAQGKRRHSHSLLRHSNTKCGNFTNRRQQSSWGGTIICDHLIKHPQSSPTKRDPLELSAL